MSEHIKTGEWELIIKLDQLFESDEYWAPLNAFLQQNFAQLQEKDQFDTLHQQFTTIVRGLYAPILHHDTALDLAEKTEKNLDGILYH